MRKWWIVLFVLPAFALAGSDIYQTTDQNGNLHFSDHPSPGAKKVKLSPTQTYKSTPINDNSAKESLPPQNPGAANIPDYSGFRIITPVANDTFRDPSAPLVVTLEGPELAPNHSIVLSLDSPENRVTDPSQEMVYNLNDIPRGAHTLFVSVLNERGDVIFRTGGTPFFMQLPRVDNPGLSSTRPIQPIQPIQPINRPQRLNSGRR